MDEAIHKRKINELLVLVNKHDTFEELISSINPDDLDRLIGRITLINEEIEENIQEHSIDEFVDDADDESWL